MTLENTEEPPSVPDSFGGIMDPGYNQVHSDLYGDGDIDIPLPTPADVTTQADQPALSTGPGLWDQYQARQKALELAISIQSTATPDTIVTTATKFSDYILGNE